MNRYEHTQPGTLMRAILGGMAFFFGSIAAGLLIADPKNEAVIGLGIPAGVVLIVLFLFHSLTVRVASDFIRLSFGIGLIRKRFSVAEIESAEAVRTHWYNGWGIKKIWGGWLFNVSGFDAVEIRLKNGRVYRIGTDEPKRLLPAIESVVN